MTSIQNARPTKRRGRLIQLLLALSLSLLSGCAFLLITALVRADLLRSLDFAITVKLQDALPVRFDSLFVWFGTGAKFQIIVPFLTIALLLLRRWLVAFSSLVLLFFAHVIEIIGKEILFQPPPPFMFYRHPTEFVFPDLHTFDHSSYPSGHAMRAVFVSMTLSLVIWRSRLPLVIRLFVCASLLGAASMTCVTRVSLGEHWMSDVLGGAALGVMIWAINWIVVDRTLSSGTLAKL